MQVDTETSVQTSAAEPQSPNQASSTELVKLIRKLRWIGMEEEARQLQSALRRFPAEQVEPVLDDKPNTD